MGVVSAASGELKTGAGAPLIPAAFLDRHLVLIPVGVGRDLIQEREEVLEILELAVLVLVEIGELLLEPLVDRRLEFGKRVLG